MGKCLDRESRLQPSSQRQVLEIGFDERAALLQSELYCLATSQPSLVQADRQPHSPDWRGQVTCNIKQAATHPAAQVSCAQGLAWDGLCQLQQMVEDQPVGVVQRTLPIAHAGRPNSSVDGVRAALTPVQEEEARVLLVILADRMA